MNNENLIHSLPITNKYLFMRTANSLDYEYYTNDINKESFYYSPYTEKTKHYILRLFKGVHVDEGIIIKWQGNPFELKI